MQVLKLSTEVKAFMKLAWGNSDLANEIGVTLTLSYKTYKKSKNYKKLILTKINYF